PRSPWRWRRARRPEPGSDPGAPERHARKAACARSFHFCRSLADPPEWRGPSGFLRDFRRAPSTSAGPREAVPIQLCRRNASAAAEPSPAALRARGTDRRIAGNDLSRPALRARGRRNLADRAPSVSGDAGRQRAVAWRRAAGLDGRAGSGGRTGSAAAAFVLLWRAARRLARYGGRRRGRGGRQPGPVRRHAALALRADPAALGPAAR